MSKKRIVVLGGGTGGTMVANRLRRHFDGDEAEIHVVDRDDAHVYQPGLLFVPFGLAQVDEIVRPRRRQLRRRHRLPRERGRGGPDRARTRFCSTTARCSPTTSSSSPAAPGCSPRRPRGSTGPGWNERVFTFYTPDSAVALHAALERFDARPAGREPGRHADQVPGRAARVRLPRRLVPARARHPRPRRARLLDPARRRLHEAGRLASSSPGCSARRRSSS